MAQDSFSGMATTTGLGDRKSNERDKNMGIQTKHSLEKDRHCHRDRRQVQFSEQINGTTSVPMPPGRN